MYYVKKELVWDLKAGNNNSYLASIIGISQSYLSEIFNGRHCSKSIALCLTHIRDSKKEIDYYFYKK